MHGAGSTLIKVYCINMYNKVTKMTRQIIKLHEAILEILMTMLRKKILLGKLEWSSYY